MCKSKYTGLIHSLLYEMVSGTKLISRIEPLIYFSSRIIRNRYFGLVDFQMALSKCILSLSSF